jgi:hypothetical protein
MDQGGSATLRRARPRSYRAAALGGRPGTAVRAASHRLTSIMRQADTWHQRRGVIALGRGVSKATARHRVAAAVQSRTHGVGIDADEADRAKI